MAQKVKNPAGVHEDAGSIPGLTQWIKGAGVAVSCGVGHGCGSDLALLGLWCRLAAAALIRPLAWEFPYATDAALTPPAKKVAFLEHYPHFWSPLNSILLESFN